MATVLYKGLRARKRTQEGCGTFIKPRVGENLFALLLRFSFRTLVGRSGGTPEMPPASRVFETVEEPGIPESGGACTFELWY